MKFSIPTRRLLKCAKHGLCIVCGQSVVGRRTFFLWGVGATYSEDGGVSGAMDERNTGYMRVMRMHDGDLQRTPVLEDVPEGQANLYFCSRKCHWEFLRSLQKGLEDNR